MDDVARAPSQGAPVVVAGSAPVTRLVGDAAARAGHRVVTDPEDADGFTVALVAETADDDPALSPVELHTAALAPHLRPGCLLIVSSPTVEHAGVVAAATLELLTGLRAGGDYALGHVLAPTTRGRLIVSGIDDDATARTQAWLAALGLSVMPVMPVAAAEIVASLLARAEQPPDAP